MLSKEDNDILTRVGPGTPMGNLIRQYWMPAFRVDELPEGDSPPMRVRLLGEDLIAFRVTSGAFGLIRNSCPHRGASLFFGRNEEEGLRCVYHGWKFDVTGACIDMPSEPAESNFKTKVRALTYRCRERGGVVWTYMGPRETPPPLPTLATNVDGQTSTISTLMRDCNWMQALEGDIDTTHLQFLHSVLDADPLPGTFDYYLMQDKAPRYIVRDTDYGTAYGTYRAAEADSTYWRIGNWLFPFYSQPPTGVLEPGRTGYRCWVPVDDEHAMLWNIGGGARRAPSPGDGGGQWRRRNGETGIPRLPAASNVLPNTSGWLGRWRLEAGAENDYYIDRDVQRSVSFTGVGSIHLQDEMVTESMGPIYTRDREHLGTSDSMVIRVRRRLLNAAKALRDAGAVPPGVDTPDVYMTRVGGIVLPKDAHWWQATEDVRRARFEDAWPTPVAVPQVTS